MNSLVAVLCASMAAGGGPAGGPAVDVRFEEVSAQAGIRYAHERATFHPLVANVMPWLTAGGSGVAVGDYNNDGLDDIYFNTSRENGRNALYRNDGGFRFTDVAASVGLADVNGDRTGTSSFALWLDYDNDSWLDLLLLRFGQTSLFRNDRGHFTDVVEAAGLKRWLNSLAAVAFDYDRDGDLDIYIGGYFPEKDFHRLTDAKVLFESWETARNGGPDYLYRNNGDSTFTDVTEKAGIQDPGWAMAVGHGDLDNDGWQDLYIANDFGPDTLFRNNRDGTFKDVSRESIGIDTKKGMNAEFGDYNDDGWMDIYVTNMTEPYLHECNMLWRNNRDFTFTDVSTEEGACDTGWGWGAKFLDVDNDGALDIYAVNGFISAGAGDYMRELLEFIFRDDVDLTDGSQWPPMANLSMAGNERNVLLRRVGAAYKPISAEAGVDSLLDGRGVAVADFDVDGRVDIVVSNAAAVPLVYRNVSTTPNRWLEVRLEGRGGRSHAAAIGARVELRVGTRWQYREVAGGNGFEAQSSLVTHFGLGAAEKADELVVRWPDGEVTRHQELEPNHRYAIAQGQAPRIVNGAR
jgi:hypothetical protein